MKSVELSQKTQKTQYSEAMKASSLASGLPQARHTLKSAQILGFLGQFNKFARKNQYNWDSCTNTSIFDTNVMKTIVNTSKTHTLDSKTMVNTSKYNTELAKPL